MSRLRKTAIVSSAVLGIGIAVPSIAFAAASSGGPSRPAASVSALHPDISTTPTTRMEDQREAAPAQGHEQENETFTPPGLAIASSPPAPSAPNDETTTGDDTTPPPPAPAPTTNPPAPSSDEGSPGEAADTSEPESDGSAGDQSGQPGTDDQGESAPSGPPATTPTDDRLPILSNEGSGSDSSAGNESDNASSSSSGDSHQGGGHDGSGADH